MCITNWHARCAPQFGCRWGRGWGWTPVALRHESWKRMVTSQSKNDVLLWIQWCGMTVWVVSGDVKIRSKTTGTTSAVMPWATPLCFRNVLSPLGRSETHNMDSATLQKFRGQLDKFSHQLAEFEAAMAQGKADNPAALREPSAHFSACFTKHINSPHPISGISQESATFVFIFSCHSSPSWDSESGLSP